MLDLKKLFATFKDSFPYEKQDPSEELTDYIAERYEEVQATMQRLAEIKKEREDLKAKLDSDLFALSNEVIRIQEDCPHPSVTQRSHDHDGTFKVCDICGVYC